MMLKLTPARLIVALLLGTAGGALAQGAPQVLATPEGGLMADRVDAPAPQVNAEQSARDLPEGGLLPEMLAAIAAEREALAARTAALDLREAELAFAAAALGEQQTQLGTLKGEIERLLSLADGNHHEDVARLVRIYRAMKPTEAAAILSDADLELSVLVIAAMVERDSGPIVAKMNPIRAQAISKIILERSRLPGDQRLINVKIN